ncbi:hypothetical protein FSP39_003696 [Pinctada imbricata]|uniref:Uncharacterized protein n=1 Tax=Pinctada imbricata TaxID=66713 RepID=A0AA88Y7J0_PINIB|nr:hypothetical protein FSP39_003696 [Pinctada imbricata]
MKYTNLVEDLVFLLREILCCGCRGAVKNVSANQNPRRQYLMTVIATKYTNLEEDLEWDELEQNLTKYNYDLPPWTETGNKTEVKTTLHLTSLRSNVITELDVTFHLIQEWRDERLQYDANSVRFQGHYVLVDLDKYIMIWTPDMYISNAISETQHGVTKPNTFIRVYPNGTLIKSARITAKISCPISSSGFPRGKETCMLHLKSYSYTKGEISMIWSPQNPVIKSADFMVSSFSLQSIQTTECSVITSQVKDDYPCLEMTVKLVRDYSIYIIRIYVPSGFLVALGWLSMWIDKGQVGARTSLGVLCVLSLITQTLGIITLADGLDGVIAIDIWLAICLLFVVLALGVFAIVHNMKRRRDKTKSSDKYKRADTERVIGNDEEEDQNCIEVRHGCLQNFFRVLYPILFIIFNLIYWIYFLRV